VHVAKPLQPQPCMCGCVFFPQFSNVSWLVITEIIPKQYQLHSHVGFFRIDICGNQCGAKQARSKLCFPLPRFVCIPWQPIQMCNCLLIGVRALPESHIRSRRKNHSLPHLVNLNVLKNFWHNFQVYSLSLCFGKKVANANMRMIQMQNREYN
jgi:hypothetical protein